MNINLETQNTTAVNFISSGVACYALLVLHKLNILPSDTSTNAFVIDTSSMNRAHALLIETALIELKTNSIIYSSENTYYLTELGVDLLKYIGLISYIYDGYGEVFSKSIELNKSPENYQKLTHDEAIVLASENLADNFIDPVIMRWLFGYDVTSKVICDLGCGNGSRLNKITMAMKCEGLGIELSNDGVNLAQKLTVDNQKVSIFQDDITNLKEVYPKVSILMQTMVLHDFTPTEYCINILNSYLHSFPNLEYFLFCDVVKQSKHNETQFPGFNYIHAMLGVRTRTYEETLNLFDQSNFTLESETAISKLPNTYLWVLKPKK